MAELKFITPDWPTPVGVKALSTTRHGGVSTGVYAALNLGTHVGDQAEAVAENRQRLANALPQAPFWLQQVHSTTVVDLAQSAPAPQADAAVARERQHICTVMTADCLPVLFCDTDASVVGAAHAGWRGLVGGILENTVRAMQVDAKRIMAWLGPAISQPAFEVGEEVREAFLAHDPQAAAAFMPGRQPGKWQADLYQLARLRLAAVGVTQVYGGAYCTVAGREDFFSARRDGTQSGRQASLIWLE